MSSPGIPAQRKSPARFETIVLYLLPILSVATVYCVFGQAGSNGTFPRVIEIVKSDKPLFPGSGEALVTKYSGVQFIDEELAILITFFAPVVQGANKSLSLYLPFGFSQFGSAWTLLMLESLRRGNSGKAVSLIVVYGFFAQTLTLAFSTPIYLLLHLLTSPVAKPLSSTHASNVLLVSSYDLAILPFSILLGYIIPTLLMIFPGTADYGSPIHQYYISFWQGFPIWTVIIQWVLRRLCILFLGLPNPSNQKKSPVTPSATYLASAGRLYTLVLSICVATTVPVLALSILPSQYIPATIPTLSQLAEETFSSVFIPPLPVLGRQVKDLSEGAHIFLQWDVYIGSLASLLWGMVIYRNAPTDKETADSKGPNSFRSWPKLLLKTAFWTVVGGPLGALTILLWERDTILKRKIKRGV